MDEVDETALRQAREQLAGDAHVAALLAEGDPLRNGRPWRLRLTQARPRKATAALKNGPGVSSPGSTSATSP